MIKQSHDIILNKYYIVDIPITVSIPQPREVEDMFENVLIDNTTKADIIDVVVWGFVLAVIVGVLTYVIKSLRGG